MNDQVTPLAALSAQMASEASFPPGFELLRETILQAIVNRQPAGGLSINSITLISTNYQDLHDELTALQGDAQAVAQTLEIFRRSVLTLISGRESAE